MGLSSKEVSSDHGHEQEQSEPLKCPRCDSTNTKFCYYNNHNKSQPRHFCKACKRHWTKGGTLRNVPVGGGRKNKRKVLKPATPKTTTMTIQHQNLSDTFYQTLSGHSPCSSPGSSISFRNKNIDEENNGIFMGSFENDLNFPYSNLGNFEQTNPCSMSSIKSPNLYNFTGDQASIFLGEPMMNNLNTNLSENQQQQQQQQQISWSIPNNNNSSNLLGISSNWVGMILMKLNLQFHGMMMLISSLDEV